ncbi:MAG: 1-acyl-sn-glycerol-3-phosphate acyltransferase [Endomicrobia bacterium]|nr:1-acyl-sn-glycerol-3-phosphate acyltransferase [Endomicrobiia bacterium]
MADFLKKIYASFFAVTVYAWLFIAGFAAYIYFFLTGYKEKQIRIFLYAQGKIIQAAIVFASGFNKKIIKCPLPEKPSVLVANHPSTYDTFVFHSFNIINFVCIAKGWPFRILFYGKFIERAGYINSDNKTAGQIIDLAKEKLNQGLHVAIFPEGTRQKKTGRFRSLAFALAIAADTYVVPFAIKGLEEMLPPGKYMPTYSPIVYKQLPAVYAGDFNYEAGDLRMAKYVKESITEELKNV